MTDLGLVLGIRGEVFGREGLGPPFGVSVRIGEECHDARRVFPLSSVSVRFSTSKRGELHERHVPKLPRT